MSFIAKALNLELELCLLLFSFIIFCETFGHGGIYCVWFRDRLCKLKMHMLCLCVLFGEIHLLFEFERFVIQIWIGKQNCMMCLLILSFTFFIIIWESILEQEILTLLLK